MNLKDTELKAMKEERDNLKADLQNTELAKDEIVKKVKLTIYRSKLNSEVSIISAI